jgi:hypothetical protein
MPQLTGSEVEALYADGDRWLAGKPIERVTRWVRSSDSG